MSLDGSWYILNLIEKAKDRKKRAHEQVDASALTLLVDSLIARHTKFTSIQQLFDESGFEIHSVEEFHAIPAEQWDAFIDSSSEFDSWDDLLQAIEAEYSKRNLN